MTATVAGLAVPTRNTYLELTFGIESAHVPSLLDMERRLHNTYHLMVVGFWADVYSSLVAPLNDPSSPYPVLDLGPPARVSLIDPYERVDPRPVLEGNVRVSRLSYNSPMQVVLSDPRVITGMVISGAYSAARGVLAIASKWQDYRLKRAYTDAQVAAWETVRRSLPEERLLNQFDLALPGHGEMDGAVDALLDVESARVVDEQGNEAAPET